MINIKNLTVRNFMSVGNATQAVNFDRQDLTLVLGENLDLGGDGSRNGTGKTTIINALSYALYGNALSNIRKDNLVNKTNGKHMLVSIDFLVNSCNYRIERGRKPNVLKFYVDSQEQTATDESQGDSRETQEAIDAVLGMKHDMFKHILALNTYTDPFLSLKANEQRIIIEQLLGITQLSDRADRIKEQVRATKESVSQEEFRIRAVQEANKRIQEQIESLKKRQKMWTAKRNEDAAALAQAIADLECIDIEQEIQSHRDLEVFHTNTKTRNAAEREIKNLEGNISRLVNTKNTLEKDIISLQNHQCHACGQGIHDAKQDEILQSKQHALDENINAISNYQTDIQTQQHILEQLGPAGAAPRVFYDTLEHALNHRNSLDTLSRNLESKMEDQDPYQEQIEDMQNCALQEVSYDLVNEFNRLQEHQEFLLKLLTSKDSFVRKKIIDQNLSYLNSRLIHYLDRIGLPHTVKFQNDLTVSIEEYGRELDFDNLSRGERTRLILGMCWAFRDVWESLYQPINLLFIDELMDNGLDTQGVESGLALLKKMSRERHKSIWLVSHRDELAGRVENILKVIKSNGFTEYNTDVN